MVNGVSMRRSRVEVGSSERAVRTRPSVREAMLFDIRSPETDDDFVVLSKRVSMFTYAPWLLAATHLIIGALLVLRGLDNASWGAFLLALFPLGLALTVDIVAAGILFYRRRLGISPQAVGRLMLLYIGGTGILWMLFGAAAWGGSSLVDSSFLPLALGAGLAVKAMVCLGSPPLTIINGLMAAIGTVVFARDLLIGNAIPLIAVLVISYSIAISREMLASSRHRLQLEWQANKALNFVAEFEASGRGWFWETNAAGTLSYISRQRPADVKTNPEAPLRRQFTDLLSVRSRTWWSDRPAPKMSTGRCPAIRSSMNMGASWAFAGSAPT